MRTIRLTAADVARLDAAQRALLSPYDHPDPGTWQLSANRAVRRLIGADHAVFSVPDGTAPALISDDTDPRFAERFVGYCVGIERGEYRFRDAFVEGLGRARRAAGTGAYHQHMLGSREAIERSTVYRELFVPSGLMHMVGFSVPLAVGEATQFFGFEGRGAARRSERGVGLLNLLVAAFEAGVRSHLLRPTGVGVHIELLERAERAAVLFSVEGAVVHRTGALGALLVREPEAQEVWAHVCALGAELAARLRAADCTAGPAEARTCLATSTAEYRLVGSLLHDEARGPTGVLVLVERLGPEMPAAEQVCSRFGLTPREADAALLLAEGLTDGAIANRLALSQHTARRYTERVLRKLGLHSRAAVAVTLLRGGRNADHSATPPPSD
jgi:DNA-binding CsgD family transcriptional regulator